MPQVNVPLTQQDTDNRMPDVTGNAGQKVTNRGRSKGRKAGTATRVLGGAKRRTSEAAERRRAWEKAEQAGQAAIASMIGTAPAANDPEQGDSGLAPTLRGEIARLEKPGPSTPDGNSSTGVQQVLPDSAEGKPSESVNYLEGMRSEARRYSQDAVKVLVRLMNDSTAPPLVQQRAAVSLIEIAEREPGQGKKRLGELTITELRELANSLRNQERLIGSGATVEGEAKTLTDEGRQPDQSSSSLDAQPVTIDQVPATPAPDRPRRAIE